MPNTVVATLTRKGYVKDGKTILDTLFAWTIIARRSQSDVFYGKILSLDELFMEYKNQPETMAVTCTRLYREYLSPHFDEVDVEIKAIEEGDNPNVWGLQFMIVAHRDGRRYDLSENFFYDKTACAMVMERL